MRARWLLTLLCVGFAAGAGLARVKADRLFEFTFKQEQCGPGKFVDEVEEAIVGTLNRVESETSCPSVGVTCKSAVYNTPDIQSSATVEKLVERMGKTSEGISTGFTIELWLRAQPSTVRKDPKTGSLELAQRWAILTLGSNRSAPETPLCSGADDESTFCQCGGSHNLIIMQKNGAIEVDIHQNHVDADPTGGLGPGTCRLQRVGDIIPAVVSDDQLLHVVVRGGSTDANGGTLEIAVNRRNATDGSPIVADAADPDTQVPVVKKITGPVPINLTAWQPEHEQHHLLLGSAPALFWFQSEFILVRPWQGQVYLAAMYNRRLTDTEVQQNFDAFLPSETAVVPEDGSTTAKAVAPGAVSKVTLTSKDLRASTNPLAGGLATVRITALPNMGTLYSSTGAEITTATLPFSVQQDSSSKTYFVRYRAPPDAFSPDNATEPFATFGYSITATTGDGSTATSHSVARLRVQEVNDPPVAAAASALTTNATAGVQATFDVAAGATDVEGDAVTDVRLTSTGLAKDVSLAGTVVSFTYPAASQGTATRNGEEIVDSLDIKFKLIDARGGEQLDEGTLGVTVRNALRAIPNEKLKVPELGNNTATPGQLPAGFLVTLEGADTAVPGRKLTFHVDSTRLPGRGAKLYQLAKIAADGSLEYDVGSVISSDTGLVEVSNVACLDGASTPPCKAYLVLVPAEHDFSTPSQTAGTSNGTKARIVAPKPIAAATPLSVHFVTKAGDGSKSVPAVSVVAIDGVPSAPVLAAVEVDGKLTSELRAAYVESKDLPYINLTTISPFAEAGTWTDYDLDAYEWKIVATANMATFRCNAAAEGVVDFTRLGGRGGISVLDPRKVFFGMPSNLKLALTNMPFHIRTNKNASLTIDATNCGPGSRCCPTGNKKAPNDCFTSSLTLRVTAFGEAIDKANEEPPCGLFGCKIVIPGIPKIVTPFLALFIMLVMLYMFYVRFKRQIHALVKWICSCCGAIPDMGSMKAKLVPVNHRSTNAKLMPSDFPHCFVQLTQRRKMTSRKKRASQAPRESDVGSPREIMKHISKGRFYTIHMVLNTDRITNPGDVVGHFVPVYVESFPMFICRVEHYEKAAFFSRGGKFTLVLPDVREFQTMRDGILHERAAEAPGEAPEVYRLAKEATHNYWYGKLQDAFDVAASAGRKCLCFKCDSSGEFQVTRKQLKSWAVLKKKHPAFHALQMLVACDSKHIDRKAQAAVEIQAFLRTGKFDDPTLAAKGNRRADHISWDQFWGLFCAKLEKITWAMRSAFPKADSVATVDLEGDGDRAESRVNPLMDIGGEENEGMSGPRFSMNPGNSPWVKDHDEQGRAFFFNKLTNESTWTEPADYDAAFDDDHLGAGTGGFGRFGSQVSVSDAPMKSAV